MKRFRKGDLAVTVNSRAPLLNNGHIVRIVEVAGPVPEHKVEFGYYVERINGRRFVFVRAPGRDRFGRQPQTSGAAPTAPSAVSAAPTSVRARGACCARLGVP